MTKNLILTDISQQGNSVSVLKTAATKLEGGVLTSLAKNLVGDTSISSNTTVVWEPVCGVVRTSSSYPPWSIS